MDNNSEMIATEMVSCKGRPKGKGKRKIEIKEREDKEQIYVTFSKRRKGLYKKADEFNSLTGYTFAVIVFSPSGRLFWHGNPSFDEVFGNYLKHIKEKEGRRNMKIDAKIDAKREAKKEEEHESERGGNELVTWLRSIPLEEYDDVQELVMLKDKLLEFKEKARAKICGEVHQLIG